MKYSLYFSAEELEVVTVNMTKEEAKIVNRVLLEADKKHNVSNCSCWLNLNTNSD